MTLPSAPLPPGTHVIYSGHIGSEYAESYTVEGVCDCRRCTGTGDDGLRYKLRGQQMLWDSHERRYAPTHGADLVHVSEEHVVPSPESPQPWQINMQILAELGVRPPDPPRPA